MEKLDFKPYKDALRDKAFLTENSRGRRFPRHSDEDGVYGGILDPYRLDIQKIRMSKALRRLSDKTQVFPHTFSDVNNVHVRTRGSHTCEVVSIAVILAEILGLNVQLVEAIAWGHDVGHAPYGHLGERTIASILEKKFRHEIMSVIVLQQCERRGGGLNLSFEVLEGILHHSRSNKGLEINHDLPLEYALVMLSDKIAYIFSDLNDAVRVGCFSCEAEIPYLLELGLNQRKRNLACLHALVKESAEKGFVSFSESVTAIRFNKLRNWAYENLYNKLDLSPERLQLVEDLKTVHGFLASLRELELINFDPALALALMTDGEAELMTKIAERQTMKDLEVIKTLGFYETARTIPGEINLLDPDLDWGKKK
jgi:dGTPase